MNRRDVIIAVTIAAAPALPLELEPEESHLADFTDPDSFLGLPRPPCEYEGLPDKLWIFLGKVPPGAYGVGRIWLGLFLLWKNPLSRAKNFSETSRPCICNLKGLISVKWRGVPTNPAGGRSRPCAKN